MMNKPASMRCNMFTKSKTKLDKAVLLSVAAMLTCNIVIMTQQLTTAPHFTQSAAAPAQQV